MVIQFIFFINFGWVVMKLVFVVVFIYSIIEYKLEVVIQIFSIVILGLIDFWLKNIFFYIFGNMFVIIFKVVFFILDEI